MGKKTYKFLYIEDEVDKVNAQIQGLERTSELAITLQKADSFEKLFEKNVFDNIDGLILDYRLDVNKEGQERAFYKAPSLAQELRNKILENEINNDFPIILCSTDKQRIEPLQNDSTSNDLFDFRYLKDESFDANRLIPSLYNLADGYKNIATNSKNLNKVINRDILEINQQVFTKFLSKKYPPHEIARFIIHQILEMPSIVVDEYLLAARLGIDIEKSKDWDKVKNEVFKEAKYTGVFGNIWERWWMDKVLSIYKGITGKSLAGLSAKQRVDALQRLDLNIVDSQPIRYTRSTRFWTICQACKKPLDPLDGYRINSQNDDLYSWQENLYISLEAYLERRLDENNISLYPFEIKRIELAKEEIINEASES